MVNPWGGGGGGGSRGFSILISTDKVNECWATPDIKRLNMHNNNVNWSA